LSTLKPGPVAAADSRAHPQKALQHLPAVRRHNVCEFLAALLELTDGSFDIVELQMVERGSYLDETLNKRPVKIPILVPKILLSRRLL
jgi:hypothetical protein